MDIILATILVMNIIPEKIQGTNHIGENIHVMPPIVEKIPGGLKREAEAVFIKVSPIIYYQLIRVGQDYV
jgi:hypothetical protein